MINTKLTKLEAYEMIKGKLSRYFGTSPEEAGKEQIYKALVMSVRDILLEKRKSFHEQVKKQNAKRVYYLCMEFLLGRSLKNNLYNLGLTGVFSAALQDFDIDIEDMYEQEPDAGLGNGGLGRLAACFMDALASQDYPAMGYSIRYEYGLFKQKIIDGWQTELPDIWLPGGEVWLTQRTDKTFKVRFDGTVKENWTDGGLKIEHTGGTEIEAVAYDMMISGADSSAVSVLRLWRSKSLAHFDMKSFSQGDYMLSLQQENEAELLTKVLYPSDNHFEGKSLRLKQQYFLVSASLQNILSDHKKRHKTLDNLPELAAIHINDTHPALAVPELMRLLMDENGYNWERAWQIVTSTIAYTNHTVMSEALETWSDDLVQRRLPRIYSIINEINERFCSQIWQKYTGDWDKVQRMSIISHGLIKMANLSVIGSHTVNGVSALHSQIIKDSIFKDFYKDNPQKFTNVTNGIAYRRWLCQSNPQLSDFIAELIGTKFRHDALELQRLTEFENDRSVLERLAKIKEERKKIFANYAWKKASVKIDPYTLFDVQAKRLHEYKRQLLNAINIISDYYDILHDNAADILPKTYIFGAKAAGGYYHAKRIIKLINYLSQDIKRHPKAALKLNVVYMEDYSVSMAECLIPAAEISEQISLAGKEASGTGNMKFMINGALTVGTLDGANVEITESVGRENVFIFGLTAEEVEQLWRDGYNSSYFYNENQRLKNVISSLIKGFNGESFADIANYLLTNSPVSDPYMCLADYGNYREVKNKADAVYLDKAKWNKMSLRNIAASGVFSADRSVREYAENIWKLKPL